MKSSARWLKPASLAILALAFSACSFFKKSEGTAPVVVPGAFAVAEREKLMNASATERFTVIALTPPGQNAELARRISTEKGSIRIADEKTGVVVAEMSAESALKLETTNKFLGSSALASYLALDRMRDYAPEFKRETLHPETGEEIDANEVRIDRSATNSQLPTHEMGVLEFEKSIQQRFGFTPNGDSTTIAIIDTGLDLAHTDVFQNRVTQSWDMTRDGRVAFIPAQFNASSVSVSAKNSNGSGITLSIPESLVSPTDHYFLGVIRESSYGGRESYSDLDQDGARDGVFPVLFTETAEGYRVAIDTNRNGSLKDEASIRSFEGTGDTVVMDRARVGLVRLNVNFPRTEDGSLKFEADGSIVLNFAGFDPGQHGTHVAGIAAGRFDGAQFGGQFRGGAPAAKLFGIRVLGANGGADADIVAGIVLAVTKGADIINMSLGSSQRPSDGQDSIALAVDQIARRADVLFMISAGNSGAGMNSVGSPSTAGRALSIGAHSSGATWRTAYNAPQAPLGHFMWTFSSVGPMDNGEVRPSLVAPGAAYSSVPMWRSPRVNTGYDVFQGTSMAAPAATGAAALYLDTIRKLKGKLDLPSDPLNIAMSLVDGALDLNELNKGNPNTPIYGRFEQGAGLLNLPKAFSVLEARAREKAAEYVISTTSLRESYTKPARGVYSTSRLPNTITFTVRKRENPVPSVDEHNFYREMRISSDAPWAKPETELVPLNGLNNSTVKIAIDQDALDAFAPGVYSARIHGRCAAECGQGEGQLEFIFDFTYVKARELSQIHNRSEFINSKLNVNPAAVHRQFFFVGADRSRISATLSVPEFDVNGAPSKALYRMAVYDPLGRPIFDSTWLHGLNPRAEFAQTKPMPGVWEVVVQRSFQAVGETPAVLRFSTDSLAASPQAWTTLAPSGANQYLTQNFRLTNYGRPLTPVATVNAGKIGAMSADVILINKQKRTLEITVPQGIRALVVSTEEVKGHPSADIDLKLYAQGQLIGESGGPVAKERIEAAVAPGEKITLEIDAFDLGNINEGRVDVAWEFVLPFDLRGNVSGLTGALQWNNSVSFVASLDISPIPLLMIDDLKKAFGSAKLLGEISIFDGRALPEKKVTAIPLEVTFP